MAICGAGWQWFATARTRSWALCRSRSIAARSLSAWENANSGRRVSGPFSFLGSHPLLPDDENAYRQLFRSIWDKFSDCSGICLLNVIKESWCWRHFEAARDPGTRSMQPSVPGCPARAEKTQDSECPGRRREKSWFLYSGEYVRPFHFITLPATFEDYLKTFSSKKRHQLRREMKLLPERGGGDLQLERIENTEQIDRFLAVARPLFERSWKAKILPTCLADGKPHFEDLREEESSARTSCAAATPAVPMR